jgi:hypothetical protein
MSKFEPVRKFFRALPSNLRLARTAVFERLSGNTAANYKYTHYLQIEEFMGLMAAGLGVFCMVVPGGQVAGLCLLGAAAGVGLWHHASGEKRRRQEIADMNHAGQTVTGARADLYHLDLAQTKILALTAPFNKRAALPEIVAEKLAAVVAKTEPLRARVKTSDGKPYGFVRRHIVSTLDPVG